MSAEPATADTEDGAQPPDMPQQDDATAAPDSEGGRRGWSVLRPPGGSVGRAGAFGRPIPRGAWRQVPSYALATLTVAIAVLGYYLPLLGIPLAAFLLIDLALGRLAARRGKRTQTAGA